MKDDLVERLDDFIRRIESIAQSNMPPSVQTGALALLVSLKGHQLAIDCRAALAKNTDSPPPMGEMG